MEYCVGNADNLAGSPRARGLSPVRGVFAPLCPYCNNDLPPLPPSPSQTVTIPRMRGIHWSGKLRQHLTYMALPPTLRLALALTVAVEQRSQPAALQALRMIWEQSDADHAAERAARQVNGCLEPEQRHWLGCLRSAS